MSKEYILNKETSKIELHFEKSDYMSLTAEQKDSLKSAYLWSKKNNAWVSRSINNHYNAIRVAEKLGFTDGGSVGERLSYAEELERKAEKAEARAERYEEYSENAEKRAKQLQADFNKYRKDWSWLTQPIIAGHAGSQAFKRHKDKVMARYERGFEEYEKSEYYQDRAATARATADNSRLKDKVYLHNKIKECNSNIKKLQDSIVACEDRLYRIQQGEIIKSWNNTLITAERQEARIEELLEKYEYEQDKLEFFEKHLEELGGVQFSKENIKAGYVVKVKRWGRVEVLSTGSVNITFKILDGGASGGCLTEPYAAIIEIIEAKETKKKIDNPYSIGDILCKHRPSDNSIYEAYQVIKVTATGVKLQQIAVEQGIPIKDKFISDKRIQKKITKSKWSDFVGVYMDDWQLHKYIKKAV